MDFEAQAAFQARLGKEQVAAASAAAECQVVRPGTQFVEFGGVPYSWQLLGKVVRGYEVKNVSERLVSVTVIFESQGHTDLPKTLRFTVEKSEKYDALRITSIR